MCMSGTDSQKSWAAADPQNNLRDPESSQRTYQHLIGHLSHVLQQIPTKEISPDHLDDLVYLSQVLNDVSPALMVLRQLRDQRAA